jgi:hypothetical protein
LLSNELVWCSVGMSGEEINGSSSLESSTIRTSCGYV